MGGLATVLMNETCGDKVLCNKAITEASQLYEKYSKNYSHDRITLVNNICATLGWVGFNVTLVNNITTVYGNMKDTIVHQIWTTLSEQKRSCFRHTSIHVKW